MNRLGSFTVNEFHGLIASLAKCEAEIKWEDEAALILEVSLLRIAAGFRGKVSKEEEESRPVRPRREPARPVKEPARVERESARPEREPARRARRDEPVEAPPPAAREMEPPPRVGPPDLTGGLTLKKRPVVEKEAATAAEPVEIDVTSPPDIEQFWKDALESVRELSIHEYILLAEAVVDPPPSKWPNVDGTPLELTLRYPMSRRSGCQADRRSGAGDPADVSSCRGSGASGENADAKDRMQPGVDEGGCAIDPKAEGSPSLFAGAGRPAPSDPELRQIHDLVVNDFPNYKIEYNGERRP